MCESKLNEEAKDVGISTRRGARCACPLSRARGARKVSATCDGDGVSETDGSLVLPEVLRPAPGETVKASVPGSSSPMPAKYLTLRRWART